MGLWPELANKGKTIITDMQVAGDPSQDAVKKMFFDAAALNPSALVALQWSGIYAGHFAKVIDDHRDELRPWIMVNPAALGLLGPFYAVLNFWCQQDLPGDLTTLAPEVEDLLMSLFEGYVRTISVEELT
jgi:hypothetical protein